MNKRFENFQRGIVIAEKLTKQEGIVGVIMYTTNDCQSAQRFSVLAYAVESK